MTRLFLLVLSALVFNPFTTAPCGASPSLADRVLVLRNTNSAVSKAVAGDYAVRRHVRNLLNVACQDSAVSRDAETITFANYLTEIDTPLRAYLARHRNIDFIVMTKGIPIRIAVAQYHNCSLDSYVSALDYDKISGAIRIVNASHSYYGDHPALSWANRYWNSKKRFSHAAFGGYLVTRLDGYTEADAIALTTRSLAAEKAMLSGNMPPGPILLDTSKSVGFTSESAQPYSVLRADPPVSGQSTIPEESTWGDYNSDMALAADQLKARSVPCILDTSGIFTGRKSNLMGYISWGSNDSAYDAVAYHSLYFAPGAICETAVSTSARTFLQPYDGGQSLVADLIQQGAAGAKGYSDEPLLQAIASPSILFSRYTSGWTLAESFYAASNEVGWTDIVLGDPICRAYPQATKALHLSGLRSNTGSSLAVAADDASHILVGAIRWDAWVGDTPTFGSHKPPYVGQIVEATLAPKQFHRRLPFFAQVTAPNSVRIRELSQSVMDKEIRYAHYAGLDYWAFDWYPDGSGLDIARKLDWPASDTALGLEAASAYVSSASTANGAPYLWITRLDEQNWNTYAAGNTNVVPWVTTGFDPRPRIVHPTPWTTYPQTDWVQPSTSSQIAAHLLQALTWVKAHPNTDPARLVLMYAWNEFDEGGWLCPTLADGPARVNALHTVLFTQPVNR